MRARSLALLGEQFSLWRQARSPAVLRLVPMSSDEFEYSLGRSISRLASEGVARGLWSPERALSASRREFRELLPHGQASVGRHFLKVTDPRDGRQVGETWFLAERKRGRVRFWVDWIWIEPSYRRRGYATDVLRQLTAEAQRRGADRVGLSVLCDNKGAIALYRRLGFEPTRMHMQKLVPAGGERLPGHRPDAGVTTLRRTHPRSPRAGR